MQQRFGAINMWTYKLPVLIVFNIYCYSKQTFLKKDLYCSFVSFCAKVRSRCLNFLISSCQISAWKNQTKLPATFKPFRDLLFLWLLESMSVKMFKPNVCQASRSVHVILSAQRLWEKAWRGNYFLFLVPL